MFYEVRVLDGNGDLKKVISPKRLSARYWKLQDNGQPEMAQKPLGDENESSLDLNWDKQISRGKSPLVCQDDSFE